MIVSFLMWEVLLLYFGFALGWLACPISAPFVELIREFPAAFCPSINE
jgi:hypothetical protein